MLNVDPDKMQVLKVADEAPVAGPGERIYTVTVAPMDETVEVEVAATDAKEALTKAAAEAKRRFGWDDTFRAVTDVR